MSNRYQSESGFTLIELLVTTAIIMVLSGISIQTFREYKARAAYSVADQTLRMARTSLESSLAEPDAVFASVSAAQSSAGAISDPSAYALFSSLRLPKNIKIQMYHEPTCADSSCIQQSIQVNHCQGLKYVNWTRFGDSIELLQQQVNGAGCP